jgi:hypothetical protein
LRLNNPLKEDLQTRALRDDIIPVYKNEPPEVIANYMRKEGKFISYSDLESEPEDEYSKKRRRVTKSVKFEAVPEGQEVKKVKKEPQKKSSTVAGGSKVQNKPIEKVSQKPECIVAEVHDDSDAEVDMPLLKRSKVKHSTQKISSDSEQGLRFWMLFMSCWTVIWKNWSIIRRVLRLGWIR